MRRRRQVLNLTIKQVIINPYTKFNNSSLQGCGEICDENSHYSNMGGKMNRQIQRRINRRKLVLSLTIKQMSILACKVVEKSLAKISLFKVWKERKLDNYISENINLTY